MTTKEIILIVGATGTVGSEVVKQLALANQKIRVLARDPAKAEMKFGNTVEIIEGDLSKPETLGAVFAGVDKAFILAQPTGPEFIELEGNAFNAAKKAGVKHIVKLSGIPGILTFLAKAPFGKWHTTSEERLQNLGIPWTILRPTFFNSNLSAFGIVPRGGLSFPVGNGKEAPIDPYDIAAVAVKALTTPGHEGKIYELTGPELLSFADMVHKIAVITGKSLQFVDVPEADWSNEMLSVGTPLPVVESLLSYFADGIKVGLTSNLTSTVSELLGRPARTLDAWAKEHIAELQG